MKRCITSINMLALFFSVLFNGDSVATIKPSLEDLVSGSTWIVTGKVVDIENPGEEIRKITIEPNKIFKGQFVNQAALAAHSFQPKRITFTYERIGKGNIDFSSIKERGDEYIFMLRAAVDNPDQVENLHILLTDAWFGTIKGHKDTMRRLEELLDLSAGE